jgi:hypothetical protein
MTGLTKINYGLTVGSPYASKFQGLLEDLEAAGYKIDPKQSGGYNYRNIAGTNRLSNHAYGRALDVNWTDNARGTKGKIDPTLARTLAQKHGLVWGGDWSNPDPMHFEVAGALNAAGGQHNHSHPSTASTPGTSGQPAPNTGAAPMAYSGATPDSVARQRAMAQALMMQGMSGAPVGHWTQALGRVLQAGVGSMWDSQAAQGEKEGKASANAALAAALRADPEKPQEAIAALNTTPWAQDMGQELTKGMIAGRFTAPKKTDDIIEWEAAGKPGTIQEWIHGVKRAGAINIDQRAQTAEEKVLGEGAGAAANKVRDRADAAMTNLQRIGTMTALQGKFETGPLAEAKMNVGQWAKALGVSEGTLESWGIGKDFVGDAQAFRGQANRGVVDMIGAGGFPANNFSDADRSFLTTTVPQLANDPRGNKLLMEFARRVAHRDIEKQRAWTAFRRAPENKGKGYDEFNDTWADKVQKEDISGDLVKEAQTILASPATAATPSKALPPAAVEMLRKAPTPEMKAKFDEVFGPGAADMALGAMNGR